MYNTPMTKILYRIHAIQRMFEREISASKVRRALEAEDVIEDYSAEMPEPMMQTSVSMTRRVTRHPRACRPDPVERTHQSATVGTGGAPAPSGC